MHEDDAPHPHLELWRANVGRPIALDLAPPAPQEVDGIDVLNWNVAVGRADLAGLLRRLHRGDFGGAGEDPRRPFVLLIQEASRADDSIPELPHSRFHGGRHVIPGANDIVELARQEGLSLRYAPAMRNGLRRSDRGCAILANIGIAVDWELDLPYVRQRRNVLAAALAGLPDIIFASAHLENRGRTPRASLLQRGVPGRHVQARSLARQLLALASGRDVILAGDLNTQHGPRDEAVQALHSAGFELAPLPRSADHTFHGLTRLYLDHVLVRKHRRITDVTVTRLDEIPSDRGRIFGSDHHPLLARITLSPHR